MRATKAPLPPERVAVLGGGSFGTVLANMIVSSPRAPKKLLLWARHEATVKEINNRHCNSRYLPARTLNRNLRATTSLEEATTTAELVILAVPSHAIREIARAIHPTLGEKAILLSTVKGIEAGSFKLPSEVICEELPEARLAVLSGPNLAGEIFERRLTGTVIASNDLTVSENLCQTLNNSYFRAYLGRDMRGLELGGALKNIYAIAAGMAAELQVGHNSMGMLMTRALGEMARFACAMGGESITFLGLSGVGDLIVTCSSPASRNYRLGQAIARGHSCEEACKRMRQVVEGVNTLREVERKSSALGVPMPIAKGVHNVLFGKTSIKGGIHSFIANEQIEDVLYPY